MAVYTLSRYPKTVRLSDGKEVVIRPMTRDDASALRAFFLHVPNDERYFLKDDVASEGVTDAWAAALDYDRALPLLAVDGDRVCADGVLIRHRGDARSRVAEARIVVSPEYRSRGLGTTVLRELCDIACDAELDAVQLEMIRDIHVEAIRAVELLGGTEYGHLREAVCDRQGDHHDIVFMRIPLGRAWQWSHF